MWTSNAAKAEWIASQRIGKNLWRQVFRVTFPLKSGDKIEAIVMNGASAGECSLGPTQIFLVSKELLSSQWPGSECQLSTQSGH
jgi:hypothetical protein